MWPRLSQVTALVSVLAAFFALVYQTDQIRKECHAHHAHLSLTQCIWEVLIGGSDKTDGEGKIENTELDEEAWRIASSEDSPEAYWQYLNHPWTQHAGQAMPLTAEIRGPMPRDACTRTRSNSIDGEF